MHQVDRLAVRLARKGEDDVIDIVLFQHALKVSPLEDGESKNGNSVLLRHIRTEVIVIHESYNRNPKARIFEAGGCQVLSDITRPNNQQSGARERAQIAQKSLQHESRRNAAWYVRE